MNALIPLAEVVVSGGGVVHLFVALVVLWLLFWILTQIPGIDAAVLRITRVIALVVSVLLFINWLLGLDGHALFVY